MASLSAGQIRLLQTNLNERLRARGRATVTVDGEYGPQTAEAVHLVKYLLGFPLDSLDTGPSLYFRQIVQHPAKRNATYLARAAARTAYLKTARVRVATATSARGKAVAEASRWVGTTEHPAGSNGGPHIDEWQREFGFGHVAWCGIYCGHNLRAAGVQGVTSRIASVALIEEDAKAGRGPFRGWTRDGGQVLRGDLVVIGGYGVHVETVVKVNADGSVDTIGGNTSFGPGGSQSNGGCVAKRRRSRGEIHGFALVNYPG